MFQRTLRRLTLLISLVFLLIFMVFASTIYGYIAVRQFDKIDEALAMRAQSFRLVGERNMPMRGRPIFDPRIFLLLRSEDGRIANLASFRNEDNANLAEIAIQSRPGRIEMKEYETHVYRVLCLPYLYEEKLLRNEHDFIIKDVIAVSIVDPEIDLLNNLLWIIAGGLLTGMAAIIAAGYYLAKRAMIPIEAAWEKQQRFVADASHELRSPLTGIQGNAELMLRHPGNTVEQESNRLHTIMKEVSRMTKLITSLLTLARFDANQTELQLSQVDLGELIELVAEHFRPLEELEQKRLAVAVGPDVKLTGDRDRLHQLLVILIDNAFKYTPKGGLIEIAAERQDKNVVFSVRDSGCGIKPENLPHIFDRFFREDKARSRDKGGIGLGLAIAKWIVDTHEGRINVASQPGVGSVFKVSLPVGKLQKDN
ncbi:MAG: HAMP domain-containing sensor histidine kinase [Sporomusaceae bacterium]|nr:HAMP domain-containing sensor histidine kinase [Sporomusaceae bacterium]